MKYNNGLMLSVAALAVLTTGCVKKTTADTGTIYGGTETTYESGSPIVYETTGTTTTGVDYNQVPTDSTVITTTDAYGQPAASTSGAYNDPYAATSTYSDPYANQPVVSSSATTSTTAQAGGIHLQIAALKDYYAAEQFKNNLSLDPKYSAYVQQGAMNKVIVTGISSVSEANQLKATRFPGAFIVSGGSSAGISTGAYTTNTPYATSTTGGSGFGVQIGAFSSHSKAQSVASSASGKYTPLVKMGTSNGKTIYKAILTGFASEQEARSFIAQRGGVGFLVHGL